MRVTQMSAFNNGKNTAPPVSFAAVPVHREPQKKERGLQKLLASFETDDYILAGIIIVLIMEGCEDYILLAALGYLFIMGLRD